MAHEPFPVGLTCLSRAESFRDPGTNLHERRVILLIEMVANRLGIPPEMSYRIGQASLLHDIGKIAVPVDLLQKSTPLTAEESALIRTHCRRGYDILHWNADGLLQLASEIALHHHERHDGTGYPDGIAGDDIPLPCRIVSVCDAYDALRQDRPYRRGLSHEQAMNVLLQGDGRTLPRHFAPEVLSAFESLSDAARSIFDSYDDAADLARLMG